MIQTALGVSAAPLGVSQGPRLPLLPCMEDCRAQETSAAQSPDGPWARMGARVLRRGMRPLRSESRRLSLCSVEPPSATAAIWRSPAVETGTKEYTVYLTAVDIKPAVSAPVARQVSRQPRANERFGTRPALQFPSNRKSRGAEYGVLGTRRHSNSRRRCRGVGGVGGGSTESGKERERRAWALGKGGKVLGQEAIRAEGWLKPMGSSPGQPIPCP